jgi:hypothetical protein
MAESDSLTLWSNTRKAFLSVCFKIAFLKLMDLMGTSATSDMPLGERGEGDCDAAT